MRPLILALCAATGATAVFAQNPARPATTAHRAVVHSSDESGVKLPPGVPPVHGAVKTAFSLRYEDIKIGTGEVAEPNKIYKVLYTGWLAASGRKFDATDDHPRPPVMGKDGKPVLDANGKPELGPPEPIAFPQGFGRVIPGFDQGFNGMRVGGKRRLFIPWQLAYGDRERPGPDAAHPGIPAKSDLIFDVELVSVTDIQMPANHPGMGGMRMMPGGHPGMTMPPGHPAVTSATPNPEKPATPTTPPAQEKPATPAQPQQN